MPEGRRVECGLCGEPFYLCHSCERGQKYCPDPCAGLVREASKKEARRAHQRSPEGAEDHRERNRDYRGRQKALRTAAAAAAGESVMDTTSKKLAQPDKVGAPPKKEQMDVPDDRNGNDNSEGNPRAGEGQLWRSADSAVTAPCPEPPLGAENAPGVIGAVESSAVTSCAVCGRFMRLGAAGAVRRAGVGKQWIASRRGDRASRGPPA